MSQTCRYWVQLRKAEDLKPIYVFREREGASLAEARSILRSEWFDTDIGRDEGKIFGPEVSQLEYSNENALRVHGHYGGATGLDDAIEGTLQSGGAFVEVTEAEALALIASWDAPTEPPPVTMPELWNRFRAVQKSGLRRG